MTGSRYIVHRDEKSFCPKCGRAVSLLAHRDGSQRTPWFYICFVCELVAEVGRGECEKL